MFVTAWFLSSGSLFWPDRIGSRLIVSVGFTQPGYLIEIKINSKFCICALLGKTVVACNIVTLQAVDLLVELWTSLKMALLVELWTSLKMALLVELWTSLKMDLLVELWTSLKMALLVELWTSLKMALLVELWTSLKMALLVELWTSLKMAPFVELWTSLKVDLLVELWTSGLELIQIYIRRTVLIFNTSEILHSTV